METESVGPRIGLYFQYILHFFYTCLIISTCNIEDYIEV